MAHQVLKDCKLWLAQYDLSGAMSALALEYAAELQDATAFGHAGRARRGGLTTIIAQHEGFWDGGDDGPDAVLSGRIGLTDVPMSVAPLTGADGEPAYTFRCALGQYSPGAAVGEMHRFSVAAEGSAGEPLVSGTVLHNATRSSTGNGTARNLGALAAGRRLYGALHVLAASGGTPTLDVVVQSDDAEGFASPTTRLTFPQQTARGAAWATPVAGPVTDTWWRVGFTIGGSTPSFTFVVIVGFA